jgi:hypothetical protein
MNKRNVLLKEITELMTVKQLLTPESCKVHRFCISFPPLEASYWKMLPLVLLKLSPLLHLPLDREPFHPAGFRLGR